MRDPYVVLGLTKNASVADIKTAFRKLAKKFHPDQNKDIKAKERFSEIGQAYEILGDEKKRGAYDRGEIDAEGKPRAPQFSGFSAASSGGNSRSFDFDFGGVHGSRGIDPDIFAEMFSSGMRSRAKPPQRGEDVIISASVPLGEVATGGSVRVVLPSGKSLDVSAPAGFEDGKVVRLRGQGEPGIRNGLPGDALITLRYKPHPFFQVEGRDLRLELPIALYEAVLGAKVRVPTLTNKVEIDVPAGTSSGKTLRLRGKGLPGADGGHGDLLIVLRIALPQHEEPTLVELMREWRDTKPYDPRKNLGG